MKIAILGCGRAGCGLAIALSRPRKGLRLAALWSRNRRKASRLARLTGAAPIAASHPAGAVTECDVILMAVPDRIVPSFASRIASGAKIRGKVFLHLSGSLDLAPLRALQRRGALVGSIHPLTVFPPVSAAGERGADDLRDVFCAIDGRGRALRSAREIARATGGIPFRLKPESRASYHAAAAIVANHTTVLFSQAADILVERAGLTERSARRALGSLLRSALRRIEEHGAKEALTGPASRGDAATLARHLGALGAGRPARRLLYALAAAEAVRIARERGRLDGRAARAALAALGL